jgi:hypothetical protein
MIGVESVKRYSVGSKDVYLVGELHGNKTNGIPPHEFYHELLSQQTGIDFYIEDDDEPFTPFYDTGMTHLDRIQKMLKEHKYNNRIHNIDIRTSTPLLLKIVDDYRNHTYSDYKFKTDDVNAEIYKLLLQTPVVNKMMKKYGTSKFLKWYKTKGLSFMVDSYFKFSHGESRKDYLNSIDKMDKYAEYHRKKYNNSIMFIYSLAAMDLYTILSVFFKHSAPSAKKIVIHCGSAHTDMYEYFINDFYGVYNHEYGNTTKPFFNNHLTPFTQNYFSTFLQFVIRHKMALVFSVLIIVMLIIVIYFSINT